MLVPPKEPSLLLSKLQSLIGKEMPQEAPPISRWIKAKVLTAEYGYTVLECPVMEYQLNPAGVLHGGVHSMILDEVIGMTVSGLGLSQLYLTTHLHIDILKGAKVGNLLKAEGKVLKIGKTTIYAEGSLYAEDGSLLSRAVSQLVNTGQVYEPFAFARS